MSVGVRHGAPLLVCLLVLAMAGDAGARIVFECAPGLCQVNDDGTGQRALPITGPAGPLVSPSLSRDGRRLAFRGGDNTVHVGDGAGGSAWRPVPATSGGLIQSVQLSPDGGRLVYTELFAGFVFPWYRVVSNADGSARNTLATTFPHTGWAPGGHPMRGAPTWLCAEGPAEDACVADMATRVGPGTFGVTSSLSPDERLVAVSVDLDGSGAGTETTVALYDTVTQALVRELTGGAQDTNPVFSPDGRWVAFTRNGATVAKVPAEGGGVQVLASGANPTWGADLASGPAGTPPPPSGATPPTSSAPVPGAAPTPASSTSASRSSVSLVGTRTLRRSALLRRGLRVRLATDRAGRASLRLTSRGKVLARGAGSVSAGGASVVLRATAGGRRTLRRGRRVRAVLSARVTPPGAAPATTSRAVVIR